MIQDPKNQNEAGQNGSQVGGEPCLPAQGSGQSLAASLERKQALQIAVTTGPVLTLQSV